MTKNTDTVLTQSGCGEHKALRVAMLALPVGMLAGLVGVLMREGIDWVTHVFYNTGQKGLAEVTASTPFWQLAGVLMLVGLFIGLWTKYFMPSNRMHGPPDVIESSMFLNGRMSLRAGLGVFVMSIAAIGGGASVGRFGPALHVGATVGAKIAEFFKFNRQMSQTILAAGVGAVISASFNVPIAGVFFALEVVLGSYALANFAPVVVASLAGTAVSRYFYGNEFAFQLPEYSLAPVTHVPLFVLLGGLAALTAIVLMELNARVQKTHTAIGVPPYLRPVIGGFLLAVIAWQMPYVLGSGEDGNAAALFGELSFDTMVLFFGLKIIATAVCLGSGFAGGVFAPAITLGILLGSFFGIAVGELGMGENLQGFYALAAISAVCAVVLGATISTIMIVFEMSGDYSLTFGVMLTTVVACQLGKHYYGHSFFTKALAGRGVLLDGGREKMVLKNIKAEKLMRDDYSTLPSTATFSQIRKEFLENDFSEIFIVDNSVFKGLVTPASMGGLMYDTKSDKGKTANAVIIPAVDIITPDANINDVMHLLEEDGDQNLPVVNNLTDMEIQGVLLENDVLQAYCNVVEETRSSELR